MSRQPRRRNLWRFHSAYAEGNLDGPARRRFEELIARDPELAADWALFRRTRQAVADLPAEPAPAGFERRVLFRLRAERTEVPVRVRLRAGTVVATAAASLVLGLALGLLLPRSADETDVPGTTVAGAEPARPPDVTTAELEDPELDRQLEEMTALIEEINTLNREYRLGQEEILLTADSDRELVFRPADFYRRAAGTAAVDVERVSY